MAQLYSRTVYHSTTAGFGSQIATTCDDFDATSSATVTDNCLYAEMGEHHRHQRPGQIDPSEGSDINFRALALQSGPNEKEFFILRGRMSISVDYDAETCSGGQPRQNCLLNKALCPFASEPPSVYDFFVIHDQSTQNDDSCSEISSNQDLSAAESLWMRGPNMTYSTLLDGRLPIEPPLGTKEIDSSELSSSSSPQSPEPGFSPSESSNSEESGDFGRGQKDSASNDDDKVSPHLAKLLAWSAKLRLCRTTKEKPPNWRSRKLIYQNLDTAGIVNRESSRVSRRSRRSNLSQSADSLSDDLLDFQGD